MPKVPVLWKACLFSFISSFCLMVIELVAGRILAPYIGVSLYTWTSIIGVIMAGIALGNYLGGKIADRFPSPIVVAIGFLVGALATILIIPAIYFITMWNWFGDLPIMLNFTLKITCIFFLPSVLLSIISPAAIKLTLAGTEKAGGTVGTIYAVSTAGSILGTFLTGFYFILWFGTRMTIWLITSILILSGIFCLFFWQSDRKWKLDRANAVKLAVVGALLGTSGYLYQNTKEMQVAALRESNYYNIRVVGRDDGVKILALDHLIHSYVKPEDPTYLDYAYLKMFAEIVTFETGDNKTPSTLHLGGGGYSFPRYMDAVYPGSINHVIEIDPAVTEVAHQELGLANDTPIRTFNEDARLFLQQGGAGIKYDFVIGDVFNDKSTPYQLTTLEFDRMVKNTMNEGGVYLINIIDRYKNGKYMPAFINALQHVFGHVYLFSPGVPMTSTDICTFVIAASDKPMDLSDFQDFLATLDNSQSVPMNDQGLAAYLAERKPILLTDDYVPTDILVAELIN